VIIVEELAAELQIQLAAEFGYAFPYVLGLGAEIHVIVESDLHFATRLDR
jgi:hypothetical protein